MSTAILSALPQEQGELVLGLDKPQRIQHAGRAFWTGELHGLPVILGLSGIGKVAAATTATALIERLGAERIVFTGVAGGVGDDVLVGDIVVAHEYLQHDFDASPLFPRWQVPGYAHPRMACHPQTSALLAKVSEACIRSAGDLMDWIPSNEIARRSPKVHQGLIASGDRFVSTGQESQALRNALLSGGHHVLAVEMEGAAVAQVCSDYGVEFSAVRTISDRADDQAHVDFTQFVDTVAARYAEHIVHGLLRALSLR